ncbi:MAG: hypothetical protein APR54_02555 [Candidatus Cloacimonas sp. SDB]|nr:MAG: hypothetical protein APR54_02555 [Candidatus Cloacimonas sp. SDB]
MKILYITPYNSTFIHNQINKINNESDIISDTILLYDYYYFLRNKPYRKHIQKCMTNEIKGMVKCPYLTLPKRIFHNTTYWKMLSAVRKKIRNSFDYDIIHAHTILPGGFIAAKLSEIYNTPFIITSHGSDFYKTDKEISSIRKIIPYNKKELSIFKEVLSKSEKIISVSKNLVKDIRKVYDSNKVIIIENNFDNNNFYQLDKFEARKQLKLPTQKFIILSVGSFLVTKGHKYLIESMCEINKNNNANLYLIGSGNLEKMYKKQIEKLKLKHIIKILPPKTQKELNLWYNASDCFVLPSIHESFGIVILEAMACGVPVIATKTVGPTSIITDGENGILIKTNSVEAIVNSINDIMTNITLRNKLIKNAKKLVSSQYINEVIELKKLYQGIIIEKNYHI